jgi:predicted transglutaminase-like cysteine proteinase
MINKKAPSTRSSFTHQYHNTLPYLKVFSVLWNVWNSLHQEGGFMSRKQHTPHTAWNCLWHIFFPWIVGVSGDGFYKAVPVPVQKTRKKITSLLVAGTLGLCVMIQPVQAENDYGDFVKRPTSQRKVKENTQAQKQIVTPPAAEQNPLMILASVNSSALSGLPNIAYPSLFGSSETRYDDLTAFTKWSGVLERFRDSFEQNQDKRHVKKWMQFLKAVSELDREDKIKAVNTYMNKIKFKSDKDNYGMNDYWATPMEFLARGGDCEDYAVAKYISLRAMGLTDKDMRLAIVYDHQMKMPHAVLVVYEENGTMLVLDNQSENIKRADKINRYQPIYSINQLAWWRH